MYTDTLVNEEGCDSILLINLTVIEAPTVTITGDTVVCSGQSRLLTATAVGGGGDLSYVWSNGASDAVISVVTAGIYAVTVSNACGNGNSEVSVTTANLPLVSILARDTLCQGTPTRLLTNAVDASSFRWSTGETTTDLLVTSGGQYAVTVTNACGSSSDSVRLVELPLPEVRIVGDTILCSGDSIRLTAIADNADSYLWVAGSGDSLTTNDSMISVSIGGLFTVTVANACGQALEEQVVTERSDCGEGCRYYFPGVFSPNNDGINDGFQPLTNCIVENFEMLIFNRWGELLYRSDDATGFWDGTFRGKNCPADVYIYQLNYKFLNQEPKLAAGDVSIIR
jgi:gliding motility-associated-like protein